VKGGNSLGPNELWVIGFIVLVGAAIAIMISLNRPSRKLLNLSKRISTTEVNNEEASQMIGLLMSVKAMPKKPAFWESIKTALGRVEQSGNVDIELKQKLRILLQGLSVKHVQKIKKIS
jgi:HAMP domain-containing protein